MNTNRRTVIQQPALSGVAVLTMALFKMCRGIHS